MTNHEVRLQDVETTPADELELSHMLGKAGVDLSSWGVGEAKTLGHLLKEVTEGEAVLRHSENGIERRIGVAQVDVLYCDNNNSLYRLVEDRQEFRDGRIRRRKLSTSLGEKFKLGENPEAAAKRAVEEELGVSKIATIDGAGHEEVIRVSQSYPGLVSIHDTHTYVVTLSPDDFNPEGYVEEQSDKTSYFVWTLISPEDDSQQPQ